MGLAWWLPDEENRDDFFKFLPRGAFKVKQHVALADIHQVETTLSKQTNVAQASEIHAMIGLRESQKDQNLLELKQDIDQLFIASKELYPPSTQQLISPELSELLEEIFLLRSSLLDKVGV